MPQHTPIWFPSWIPAWFTRSRRRLWLLLMLALAAVLFLIALADAAFAQTLCGDRQEITARLQAGFGERLAATALTDGGALLEVLAAPGGSWTMLLTRPGGPACVVATGQNWRALPVSGDAES